MALLAGGGVGVAEAVGAALDSEEHHVRSIEAGVFRTQENALLQGWHEWESNYAVEYRRGPPSDWRATGLSCETTLL